MSDPRKNVLSELQREKKLLQGQPRGHQFPGRPVSAEFRYSDSVKIGVRF